MAAFGGFSNEGASWKSRRGRPAGTPVILLEICGCSTPSSCQKRIAPLVNRSGFFDMPAELARARGNDLVSTVIDVTDGRRNHSVTVDSDTEQKYKDALDPIFEVVRKKGSKALT